MFLENSLEDFLNEVDSASPAPGGGSVSALTGALGVCLARMYGHLSIGKKKFAALDESVQKEFLETFEAFSHYRQELSEDIIRDTQAYDQVMAAFKLPKTTDEEIEIRNEAISKATIIAIESPYKIMQDSLKALRQCERMIDHGNANAISDLACGAILLDAAVQGAGLNVQINLSLLNEDKRNDWTSKMNEVLHESHELKTRIVDKIQKKL